LGRKKEIADYQYLSTSVNHRVLQWSELYIITASSDTKVTLAIPLAKIKGEIQLHILPALPKTAPVEPCQVKRHHFS
jgi:hypothetical protein